MTWIANSVFLMEEIVSFVAGEKPIENKDSSKGNDWYSEYLGAQRRRVRQIEARWRKPRKPKILKLNCSGLLNNPTGLLN